MSKRVSFHELVEIELNDAAIFFENEQQGLGFRFLAAMQAAVTHSRTSASLTNYYQRHQTEGSEEVSLQHYLLNQAG